MSQILPKAKTRRRGRPTGKSQSQVVEALLNHTDRLLQNASYQDLTTADIAREASVDPAMISYYFGDRDGLLFELVSTKSEATKRALLDLEAVNVNDPGITRKIIATLAGAFNAKPRISNIIISELSRTESKIAQMYRDKFVARGFAQVYLENLLSRLIHAGVYDRSVNVEWAAAIVISTVVGPLTLVQLSPRTIFRTGRIREQWIDDTANMFDTLLRPSGTVGS